MNKAEFWKAMQTPLPEDRTCDNCKYENFTCCDIIGDCHNMPNPTKWVWNGERGE